MICIRQFSAKLDIFRFLNIAKILTMTTLIEKEHTATVVISHRIKEGQESNYENWLTEIIPISKTYPGHLGVSVIHPVPGASINYTIIIRYDNQANLINWMNSDARKRLIEKAEPFLTDIDKFEVKSGLDFWFTPEGAKAKLPTRWKQFLVTWSAIFPLVFIFSSILGEIAYLDIPSHRVLRIFSLTFVVVLMMVYVVMPRYTKLVHRWLFS